MVYTRQFQTILLLLGGLALDASLNRLTIFYTTFSSPKRTTVEKGKFVK